MMKFQPVFALLCVTSLLLGICDYGNTQGAAKPTQAKTPSPKHDPRMEKMLNVEISNVSFPAWLQAMKDAWAISDNFRQEADRRYAEGHFSEAVQLCRDAQETAPLSDHGGQMVNVFAQFTLGCAYLHLGEDEKALQVLLSLNGTLNKGEVYLAEAIAYARLGNGKMAREMYQRFQRSGEEIKMFADGFWSDPNKDADQRQFLTRAWHAYGNLELSGTAKLALLDYQKAKALDPNNPLIDFDLGFVLSRLERFEEASRYFQSAVKTGKGAFLPIAQKELALALSDLRQQKARREAEAKKQQSGQ